MAGAQRMESQFMSMPRGSPVGYGLTPSEYHPAVFDFEQLSRVQDLQGQASWLYGQVGPNETPLPRP